MSFFLRNRTSEQPVNSNANRSPFGFNNNNFGFGNNNSPQQNQNHQQNRQSKPLWNMFGNQNNSQNQRPGGNQMNRQPNYPPQMQQPKQQMPPNQGFGFGQQMPQQNQAPMQNFPFQGAPQQQQQSQQQPQQPQQNQGQQFNQPLPDGVRYEPIDDKTIKELMKNIKIDGGSGKSSDKKQDKSVESILQQPKESVKDEIAESPSQPQQAVQTPVKEEEGSTLSQIIQNEYNGSMFYNYMASIAPKDEYRMIMSKISKHCRFREIAFNGLYTRLEGGNYALKDVDINNICSFRTGVAMALKEEIKILDDYTNLYDTVNDPSGVKIINVQILKKLVDINLLNYVQTTLRN